MNTVTLFLAELAQNTVCIDPKKALPVYERILSELEAGNIVKLSFDRITRVITAFLNIAIGKLYDPALKLPGNTVDAKLCFADADEDTLAKIAQVKKYAKIFYANPQMLKEIVEAVD